MSNQPSSRTAEFSQLFAFFSELAAKGRKGKGDLPVGGDEWDECEESFQSQEFAPILRNLTSIVHARGNVCHSGNNDGAQTMAEKAEELEEMEAAFGLEGQFPFTFKMALYKLYKTDEWAEKVKEVLRKSKEEWKPLDEEDKEQRGSEEEMKSGRMGLRASSGRWESMKEIKPRKPTIIEQRLQARAMQTGRSSPRTSRFSSPRTPTSPRNFISSPRSPASPRFFASFKDPSNLQPIVPRGDNIHVTKKRCIGRRKSDIGLFCTIIEKEDYEEKVVRSWVYDAAIVSQQVALDVREPQRKLNGPSAERMTGTPRRPRYASLVVDDRARRPTMPHRRVASAIHVDFNSAKA